MHHKKRVSDDSVILGKVVLLFLIFSVVSTLFFVSYFLVKKSRLKELQLEKKVLRKKYEQAKLDQKEGMVSVSFLNELNGWRASASTILKHLTFLSNLPSDLKMNSYFADYFLSYQTLSPTNQTSFFKHALSRKGTVSVEIVDAGTKKGKFVFPKFLDQMNSKLKMPFQIEPQEKSEDIDPSSSLNSWEITTELEKEWLWKSILKNVDSTSDNQKTRANG